MNIRVLAAVAASFLLVSPSFAATTYYVAHLPKSKACVIVTAKPDGKTMMMVRISQKRDSDFAKSRTAVSLIGGQLVGVGPGLPG